MFININLSFFICNLYDYEMYILGDCLKTVFHYFSILNSFVTHFPLFLKINTLNNLNSNLDIKLKK